jgi:hypothetical protein
VVSIAKPESLPPAIFNQVLLLPTLTGVDTLIELLLPIPPNVFIPHDHRLPSPFNPNVGLHVVLMSTQALLNPICVQLL